MNNAGRLSFTLIFLFIALSCGSSEKKPPDPRWKQFIKAHTFGQIKRESTIRVIFRKDLIKKDKVGSDASSLLDLSPGISGKAEWTAANEITFTPKKPLPSGKEYRAELEVNKLVGAPDDLKNFVFYFEVIKQDFDISFDGLSTPNLGKLSQQVFKGSLTTADTAAAKDVEKILSAEQDGDDLKIAWTHSSNRKEHKFIIQGIQRRKTATKLKLKWDGDSIQAKREGKQVETIPARGEFKVMEVEPHGGKSQYITIRFSDPVTRIPRGLIRLKGFAARITRSGNLVKIFPRRKIAGKVLVIVEAGVRNTEKKKLGKRHTTSVLFESVKPGIRFVGRGVILPDHDRLTIPFEAVNVSSVQITALQVYDTNIGQFLQTNSLRGGRELRRVGRYLWRKTMRFSAGAPRAGWTRYQLDVTELFKKYPQSLFRIKLSIRRGNSAYGCGDEKKIKIQEPPLRNLDDWNVAQSSNWDYDYWTPGNPGEYNDWQKREDPCSDAYYNPSYGNKVASERNLFSSNIGLIGKMGEDGVLHVTSTDIRTAQPTRVTLKVYNFQNQVLAQAKTDGSGMARIPLKSVPFYLMAEKDKRKGFLKLSGDTRLPLSHFDVGGQTIRKGVKGYVFGERGVWRPGDIMYLSFVLEDKNNSLPDDHPLHLELFDPRGQLVHTIRRYRRAGDFYTFRARTSEDAPTGNWRAVVRLGGLSFSRKIRVEAVVPNRLRVNLKFPGKVIHRGDFPLDATFFSQWLHGGTAAGLKADVNLVLAPRPTRFTTFKDYTFDDVTRKFRGEKTLAWSGRLNSEGKAGFRLNPSVDGEPAGLLQANFTSRVFEAAGGFSTENYSIPFHHYKNYVGIRAPRGDVARGMLLTDKNHRIRIGTLSSKGKRVSLDQVQVTFYKIRWRYWYDKSGDQLGQFANDSTTKELSSKIIKTRRGRGTYTIKVKYPDWGRYLIRACDLTGGHCASRVIYMDWPGWAGRARADKGPGATRLNFTADKKEYKVGEKAVIYIPAAAKGRALVSLETGSRILSRRWMSADKGKNKLTVKLTREMSPGVYVHVSLLQPHQSRKNDRPLRLYGVIPLKVKDPGTKLQPVLKAPAELRPLKNAIYRVSEKDGRPMSYSLAIVDEGLLGLTRFRTPDLHGHFYKREALGVRTWDLFDDVVGAYTAALRRVLSIGGGAGLKPVGGYEKRRFPPVVEFRGPFKLKSGSTRAHKIRLPQYVGSVRVMVVAAAAGAYGKTEKSIRVREPLMMLTTLPRVLGPREELNIPVSLISNRKRSGNVSITLKTSGGLKLAEKNTKTVRVRPGSEKIVYFRARTTDGIGRAKINVRARGAGYTTKQEINISIRNAIPPTARVKRGTVEGGKAWKANLIPHGIENTNSAVLEVSAIPPINLGRRLKYLIHYPHGCLEQTVSVAFPQLFLDKLQAVNKEEEKQIRVNMKAAVERIRRLQTTNGGFVYWPGFRRNISTWGTTYAGHFMLEAKNQGYYVPDAMLKSWTRAQLSAAASGGLELDQGYRLFTLALAGKPAIGAMNRLREQKTKFTTTRWLLAAAYHLAGQRKAARAIADKLDLKAPAYSGSGYSYGSTLRDEAIMLYALTVMERKAQAKDLAIRVARSLSSQRWYSTHGTAFALLAMANFAGQAGTANSFKFSVSVDGKKKEYSSDKPVFLREFTDIPKQGMRIEVANLNKKLTLFPVLTARGAPSPGRERASSRGLAMTVRYLNPDGASLDPGALRHGADLIAEVEVRNTGNRKYENIVLSQIFPSGWQITTRAGEPVPGADYRDIRDDRAYTYFNLEAGTTRRFRVMLNVSYKGRYYLPGPAAELMYDATINTRKKGRWITIRD